jgi:hypothetical protein
MLTGCGVNELGYLNLSKEVGSLTQFDFNNSTQVELSKAVTGEDVDYNIDLDIVGEVNIEDLNSMFMNFDLMFKINDLGNENPLNFKITENKVYISKNSLLELIKLEEIFNGTYENEKVIDELYNVELKNVDYIMIADLSEYYSDIDHEIKYKDMNDSAMNYLTSAFKGFDSKLITKENNGYSIKLTSASAIEFIERIIMYISNNKDLVFDETIKYIENIYDDINMQELDSMTDADKEAMLTELRGSRQEFYDFVDEAVLFLESEGLKTYEEMFDGSEINEEIYKNGSSYVEKLQAELVVEDLIIGNIESNTEITQADIEKTSVSENYITADELEDIYNKTENKINPVQKLEMMWYPDSYSAEVNKIRLDEQTDWDYQSFAIIEDRIYLPLRYIGESFGEEVMWDNENKKAYVVRDNVKIDMTGVLVDSTTMVKVRDFEKLGYKIGFTQVNGLSTATIER